MIAPSFLEFLSAPRGARWLDAGCGTGALTEAVLACADPVAVDSVDTAEPYLEAARLALNDPRVTLQIGDATALPYPSNSFEVAVSGLLLNFVEADAAIAEQYRVATPGGVIGAYVWDYAGEHELVRLFWDAAKAVDPAAAAHDPAARFPVCNTTALADLLRRCGIRDVRFTRLVAFASFPSFDDYWHALDARQGSLAVYLSSLAEPTRDAIRVRLATITPTAPSSAPRVKVSAIAVAGVR